jgi:hypothetical protein
MLSSLGSLPIEPGIDFYVFVVDGHWKGGLIQVVNDNFERIAREIGPKAIIAKGFEESLFSDEVCEKYLGKGYQTILHKTPALLITDSHPSKLTSDSTRLFVPLEEVKERFGTFDKFFNLLVQFVRNRNEEFLNQFKKRETLVGFDIVELKPNFMGVGLNLNALIDRVRRARRQ